MVIYRDSDILPDETEGHMELKRSREGQSSCSSDQLLFNTDLSHPVFSSISKRETGFWGSSPLVHLFGKRQIDTPGIPGGGNGAGVNLKETIGDTTGCPTTRKVALVGVATDCGYTASFNSDDDVNKNIIKQFATASSLYEESFNITLGLAHITLSPRSCPSTPPQDAPWNTGCGGNMSITDRLNTFSQWRSERNDSNAYWSLLTSCPTGPEVGLSWLGQLCVNDVTKGTGEVVSGANVVAKTSNEWQVIAHESGHTFGAVHDCDSSACSDQNSVSAQQCCPLTANTCDAGEQYIMNPSTGQGISKFSRCTLGNVCSAIQRNSVKTTCLSDNRNVPTLQGHQCGNGIVEEGEQCDCGGRENCGGNNCCDPDTCRFRSGAVCDGSNEDCCNNCQYSQAGTVCRPSTGECDPQETCSGNNATCPTDVSSPDGQRCGNSSAGLECASGQCTSRDQQCKTLMGSYTANNDTYACNKQDCTLSCASPEFGMGVCYSMQQNFLDGTSCGGGGRCQNVSQTPTPCQTPHFPNASSGAKTVSSLARVNAKAPTSAKRSGAGSTTTATSSSASPAASAGSCCLRSSAAASSGAGGPRGSASGARRCSRAGRGGLCRKATGGMVGSSIRRPCRRPCRRPYRRNTCNPAFDMLRFLFFFMTKVFLSVAWRGGGRERGDSRGFRGFMPGRCSGYDLGLHEH